MIPLIGLLILGLVVVYAAGYILPKAVAVSIVQLPQKVVVLENMAGDKFEVLQELPDGYLVVRKGDSSPMIARYIPKEKVPE